MAQTDEGRGMQWPLLLVILGVVAGLVLAWLGHWRIGSVGIGASFVAAALLRALLPRRMVGLLRVRARWFDVTVNAALGVAIIGIALSVPSWE